MTDLERTDNYMVHRIGSLVPIVVLFIYIVQACRILILQKARSSISMCPVIISVIAIIPDWAAGQWMRPTIRS